GFHGAVRFPEIRATCASPRKGSYLGGLPAVEGEHHVRHRVPSRGDDEGLRTRSIRTTGGAPTSRDRETGSRRRPRARESPRSVGECLRLAYDVGRLLCRAVVRGTPPAEDPHPGGGRRGNGRGHWQERDAFQARRWGVRP